ncbi:glycerol kinase GlpK [Pseudoalteromonas denitrificans]|uniref:glycerol kinase n=1 Tax=Pseudoalteromonas denitrificans DSM 6059 TaxID=1123010 RepID=A0A1I1M9C1_9GAMM|nr:glycerol kinase GlpK [Pseudoalteromonas denitrificans]SFC81646.1 glycerol kinase [Pseudoalteromonas denitrificans DSM 6059]
MILAIDQGTTGTTVVIYNLQGQFLAKSHNEFSQIYPHPSWVEHDAEEIWQNTLSTIKQVLIKTDTSYHAITCIGITNQRETTVLWDKTTGKPVHNAIVWQCRRSTDICNKIKKSGKSDWIQQKTGLVVDAYFSATKIKWLFENSPEVNTLAEQDKLAFGTIDSWLIWKLTGGQHHVTDHTNASRTMLYNIHDQTWDQELLSYFSLPKSILPTIQNSASCFGKTCKTLFSGNAIPITGVAGDQQSALFGQRCINSGQVKNTYGTGCFMLMYTGNNNSISKNGLLTTIACNEKGQPAYALEGSVFIAGAAIQWLRDQLQLITHASETEHIANSIQDTQGVYFVPAFTGLGAPHWDMDARGAITGLTRGSGKNEIIRATLESIAYQTYDVLTLMQSESGISIKSMHVDGGACNNAFLMQFQADLLNIELVRPENIESTALGAILLAGIGANIWSHNAIPKNIYKVDEIFTTTMQFTQRKKLIRGWNKAIEQVKN